MAQNELYKLFAPSMFTVCLRYSSDRSGAEEILQEGFIRMFNALPQFRYEGSFEGWLRRIMVTTALQQLRRQSPLRAVKKVEPGDHEEIQADEVSVESRMNAKELMAMVQSLPPAYRTIFNLYVFEGYKHKEIASLLNISEGTSKSNLYDARQLLKEKIKLLELGHSKINCL